MTEQQKAAPLSGIRVLDLTRVRAGPTAVRQLADWGADVVKIEMPEGLEAGDPLGGPRQGSDFQNLQRNKRAMTLNLKDPRGIVVFRRLAADADVVVENFRPDVKDRLGIDYESLKTLNARIILASISGFGQDGPYRDRPGFDQIAQGMGGLMSITGLPGQGPVRVGIPIADLTAGIFCSQGIFLALIEAKPRPEKSDPWIDRLNEAGVPCGQIYSIDQVFSDPQVRHLKPQATLESPHVGKLTLLRQPMSLSRTPSRMELYPPAVGE